MVIVVLVIAGAVAFSFKHWAEGIAIAAVLLVNAGIGFLTEWKAVRSMEALREMGGDTIRVRRNGIEKEIQAEELVPGDIIVLESGDLAPADVRLIESNNLRVNEASLTGESVPVFKQVEAADADAPLAEAMPYYRQAFGVDVIYTRCGLDVRGPANHQMMSPMTGRNRISRVHSTFAPVDAPWD